MLFRSQTVEELDLAKRYRLVLVTILKKTQTKNVFGQSNSEMKVIGIVPANTKLQSGDVLLLFGAPLDLESFIEG